MAAGSTYTPIATTTLGSAAASYTFSSIPSTYTDLVLVANVTLSSSGTNLECRINGDTGSNYSFTSVYGTGGSALSNRQSNAASMFIDYYSDPNTTISTFRINFMNYSNTTTYKTVLSRSDNTSRGTEAAAGLWRSTAAINQIQLYVGSSLTFAAGTTLTLYGVLNA
jgi:hypothetical protein